MIPYVESALLRAHAAAQKALADALDTQFKVNSFLRPPSENEVAFLRKQERTLAQLLQDGRSC